MSREDLIALFKHYVIDATEVSELTGLARNSIYVYLGRPETGFPAPIPEISTPRCQRWWRTDIEEYATR